MDPLWTRRTLAFLGTWREGLGNGDGNQRERRELEQKIPCFLKGGRHGKGSLSGLCR